MPLSGLLSIQSDHIVCFEAHGVERSWREFRETVAGISARLATLPQERWAVETSNSFEYGCALFGCWHAGKTPVLAPSYMLSARGGGVPFDGIIAGSGGGTRWTPNVAIDRVERTELGDPKIAEDSDLVLFTSGSTGQPARVQRGIRNVEAELEVLEFLFGRTMGVGRVYSSVSHEHVYGMLFRLLWPLAAMRAFAASDFEYPENLLGDASGGNTLITSPALLKRLGHLTEPVAESWGAVFSSGGLLPETAARDSMRLLGVCPIEVLGSTETSGVAWRRQRERGAAEPWHALPGVRVRQAAEDFLEVRSAFVGHDGWHRMGDKVRLRTDGSFKLLGRGDHIAKIEEKRVSLAEVEQCAAEHTWVADAAAVALEDGRRQFVGLVVQLSEPGGAALDKHGRRRVGEELRQALRARLDPVAIPRKFRFVDAIPVSPQGKRQPGLLRELFGGK